MGTSPSSSSDDAAGALLTITPTHPAAAAAPRPDGRRPRRARCSPGAGASPAGAPQAGGATGFWAPPTDGTVLPATPALASAATTTTRAGFLVPVAGAALAGSALLLVRVMRRFRTR